MAQADGVLNGESGSRRGAVFAFVAGLVLALAAAVALWSSEGADVFLTQAFAALAACF